MQMTQRLTYDAATGAVRTGAPFGDLCLSVSDCSTSAGQALQFAPCHVGQKDHCGGDSKDQAWRLTPAGQLVNLLNGLCADVYNSQGPAVIQFTCKNPATENYLNQLWTYDAATRQLRSGIAGWCLDVDVGTAEVYAGPLTNGSFVAVLFNRGLFASPVTVAFADVPGLNPAASVRVRDLWAHRDVGLHRAAYTAVVPPHDVVVVKLVPL